MKHNSIRDYILNAEQGENSPHHHLPQVLSIILQFNFAKMCLNWCYKTFKRYQKFAFCRFVSSEFSVLLSSCRWFQCSIRPS